MLSQSGDPYGTCCPTGLEKALACKGAFHGVRVLGRKRIGRGACVCDGRSETGGWTGGESCPPARDRLADVSRMMLLRGLPHVCGIRRQPGCLRKLVACVQTKAVRLPSALGGVVAGSALTMR